MRFVAGNSPLRDSGIKTHEKFGEAASGKR
jgi:hypothetical protein